MLLSSNSIEDVLMFAVAAVVAIVLHECAHGLVAKWNGDYTAQYHGRITLNPVKHFDLFGFILLLSAGFGFAKPVPVNPNNFRNRKRGIILVSVAGVVTNLILAFIAAFFCVLIERFAGGSYANDFLFVMTYVFHRFFVVTILINCYLAVFNLIPVFPLDGHRILETLTGPMNRVTKFLRDMGPYILIILVLLGAFVGYLSQQYAQIPSWLDPLGYVVRILGGRIGNAFLNLWRFVMGLWENILW